MAEDWSQSYMTSAWGAAQTAAASANNGGGGGMNSSQRTVYVGNLPSVLNEEVIFSFFSCCGTVTNIRLAGDPSYATRFGFVEFASEDSAQKACTLSGTELDGKKLRVTMSRTAIAAPAVGVAPTAQQNLYASLLLFLFFTKAFTTTKNYLNHQRNFHQTTNLMPRFSNKSTSKTKKKKDTKQKTKKRKS
ncbi:MKI67 FHA domain-interacting nucleolar phosphoprotein isoform X2 [Balamuthia mandrillaris]